MGNTCGKLDTRNGGQEATCSLTNSTDGAARPFLEAIGLGIYAEAFKVAGYDTQQQLACLTEQDLDKVQWQSHIPILSAHRERILEASRCHAALQAGLSVTQQSSVAAAATQMFSAIMEDDDEGEDPEAASVTSAAEQTAGPGKQDTKAIAPTAAGSEAAACQEQHAGQGAVAGADGEAKPAQHMASDGAGSCSAAADASQQNAQADNAVGKQHQAADSGTNDAGDVVDAEAAAAPTEAPTMAARAALAQVLQKLQLTCLPWKGSQPAAAQEPETAAADLSVCQAAEGEAEQQQEQVAAVDLAAAGLEAPKVDESARELQQSTEITEAPEAAAAATVPAAAAVPPPQAGPLMANKTALPHSRLLSAHVQRRPAPTAWTQLPTTVASQVYARPPRSAQLPMHVPAAAAAAAHQEVPGGAADGVPQLQGQASSTAVAAAAALQAQRSLLAAAAALAEPAAARQQTGSATGEQQDAAGIVSDAAHQAQQQWWLQYTPSAQGSAGDAGAAPPAGDLPALCASVSPVSKSSSSRASSRQRGPAAADSMECSSVITGSVVVGAVPGNTPAGASCSSNCPAPPAVELSAGMTAAASIQQQNAAAPPAPYSLRSPSEMLPSPRRLLQQADRQQLTACLVRQLSHTNTSSSGRAGAAAFSYPTASREQIAGARHSLAQARVSSGGAQPPCEPAAAGADGCRYSAGYGWTGGLVQEQSLRQRCSATATAASVEQPGAVALSRRLRPHQSQLTVDLSRVSLMSSSSMAGSAAGDRPSSSRPGSRASDVCSIVSRAKERSAARQRLPGSTTTPRDSSSSMILVSPRGMPQQPSQQQLGSGAGEAAAGGGYTNTISSSNSSRGVGQERQGAEAYGASRAEACGAAGGEQAMRMLQDYRTMAELDAAIKARVSQLSSSSTGESGRYSRATGDAVGQEGAATAGKAVASKAAAGSWERAGAAPSPDADTANRSDCSPDRQQRQQQHRGRAGSALADTGAAVDGCGAVGLLGICEALDNSYDAGRPAAVAAAGRASAGGCSSSSGRGTYGKQAQPDAGYRNPFLSPSPTESPTPDSDVAYIGGAAAGRDAGRGYMQHRSDVTDAAMAWAGNVSNAGYGKCEGKAWGGSAGMALAGRGARAAADEAAVDARMRRIVQASRAHAAAVQ